MAEDNAVGSPTMLYRPGSTEDIWGIACDTTVVDATEVEAHLADGWYRSPLDFPEVESLGEALTGGNVGEVDTRLADFMTATEAREGQPGEDVVEAVVGYAEKLEGDIVAARHDVLSLTEQLTATEAELAALKAAQPDTSLLDNTAETIIAALPEQTIEQLTALRVAESGGKTRKTVIAAIDAALAEKLIA